MSRARGDCVSRSDITEHVGRSQQDMREKEGDLEKIATDMETVRETLEALDFGGTSEGCDGVEMSMRGAEDVTESVFDREDEELEKVQADAEDHQGEIQERTDSDNSDLEQISDASSRIETSEAVNELVKAKDAALRDIEFLSEQIRRAQDAREESEQTQQEYQRRVHSGS